MSAPSRFASFTTAERERGKEDLSFLTKQKSLKESCLTETKTRTIAFSVAGVIAIGAVGYALYFDYMRRNDAEFRKKLLAARKRLHKVKAREERKTQIARRDRLNAAFAELQATEYPAEGDLREQFFMTELSRGERMSMSGDSDQYFEAAICLVRSMKVYPNPVDLLNLYSKQMPEEVFNIVLDLAKMDAPAGGAGGEVKLDMKLDLD